MPRGDRFGSNLISAHAKISQPDPQKFEIYLRRVLLSQARNPMSSFFTLPSSERKRKRKRTETTSTPSAKKRATKSQDPSKSPKAPSRAKRNESISGSESDNEGHKGARDGNDIASSDSDLEDETGAERRLRLAEQYLENIKGEVGETVGFDAEQIDRDLIAERLKEDAVCDCYRGLIQLKLKIPIGRNQGSSVPPNNT